MDIHINKITETFPTVPINLFFADFLAFDHSASASATVIPIDICGSYIYGDNLSVTSDGINASFAEDRAGIQQRPDIPGYGEPNVNTASSGA